LKKAKDGSLTSTFLSKECVQENKTLILNVQIYLYSTFSTVSSKPQEG